MTRVVMQGWQEEIMIQLKIKKAGASQQMALLHLRWQQIRWELLQQASYQPHSQDGSSLSVLPAKKSEATA